MSLFDRITPKDAPATTTAANTSSIFGNQINTAQSTTSLFGNPNTSRPAPTSNLFGGAQPATSQPATTSLFGNTATSKPATTSLFGATTTSQAPQTNTGGLFGATNTSQAPQANTNSLFGATNATQAQPSASNASLFGGGLLLKDDGKGEKTVHPESAPPQPAYFDALLQRGKKRQTEENVGPFGELPQLQLGLQDISRKVRNLGQGGPSAGLARGTDARAHYLLSASGVNTSKALRDLDELAGSTATKSQAVADQLDLTHPSGVKETLAQKYQNDFQKMVETHILKAQDDFNKMIDEKLHGVDWAAHRRHIYEHFGLKKPHNLDESTVEGASVQDSGSFGRSSRRSRAGASAMGKSFGIPGMSRSVIGTPGPKDARTSMFSDVAEKMPADGMRPAPEDRVLRNKQEKYAEKVKDLNVARLQEKVYPIFQRFSEVEVDQSTEDASMLVNAYRALISITGEDASVDNVSDPGAIKERQYAELYLDDNVNSSKAVNIRKRIINGSRSFLEKHFYDQLQSTVTRNPREANVGGVPSTVAKVKGFVRVKASRKELGPDTDLLQELNGDYCWPVIFYLLRSGHYQEAFEYINENAAAFRQIDRSFTRYLKDYVQSDDHRLPSQSQTSINNEYSQRSRLAPEDSIDPYRMVCYKIIGRCELQKRSLDGIANATDMMDWIWLQFALAREYSRVEEFAHEAFGLDELRQSIKEIGERFFGPGSDVQNAPTTFFFMQTLAGLFEKAVSDLYVHNYVSATHFAISLDFYGLLRVSDISNSDDLLTYTTRQQPQIAFGSLVGLYTRDFRTANATAAVDYLTLICLNGDLAGDLGKRQRELCHQALNEVVLETREFAQLLGDIRSDGQRIKGTIEQRLKLIGLENEQEFLKFITLVAARTAEEQSRTTDAALLFHLAEDYDKVIQVVNDAVSLALTTELGEQPARITPLKPRATDAAVEQGSLSLTAVDDPIELAENMWRLYGSSQMYFGKIKQQNLDCCHILRELADARTALVQSNWASVIDHVTSSRLLPTTTNGDVSAIRATAQAFNSHPPALARTVGYVMLWTVVACDENIKKLRNAEFETGAQRETIERCRQTGRDVMVFGGLIRYKLPGRVWEALARVGGDVGA